MTENPPRPRQSRRPVRARDHRRANPRQRRNADRNPSERVGRRRGAGPGINATLDAAVLASSPRDHPRRRRSATTPASHADESARRFHQSIARRSPLARRTPGRSHHPRAANPPCPAHRMALGAASALPSRGPGNGILWAETGGRFQPQNAGERPEFGSQTATRLTNRPELRGFLPARKPRRFAGTVWWAMQGSNLRPLPCEGSPLPLSLTLPQDVISAKADGSVPSGNRGGLPGLIEPATPPV